MTPHAAQLPFQRDGISTTVTGSSCEAPKTIDEIKLGDRITKDLVEEARVSQYLHAVCHVRRAEVRGVEFGERRVSGQGVSTLYRQLGLINWWEGGTSDVLTNLTVIF